MKHCSTYNLAEGVDRDNGRTRGIYQMASEEYYELAVTPKKLNRCQTSFGCIAKFFTTCQVHLEALVDHNMFQRFILFCILINTFSMGIEYHDQPELLTKTVEVSNLVFSIIFLIEMILKLSAYGFFRYISDGFNVFDGVIVIFRLVELTRWFNF